MSKRDHYHCPHGCEHPQPFVAEDGRRLCGRCAYIDHMATEVVLCTPETCPEDEADMEKGYVDIAPDVAVPIEAAQRAPTIRYHVDGPLLSWAGHLHWLTWRERLLVWTGHESAESLAQKHWPRRLDFTKIGSTG